jgi:hypothetical protein
MKRTKAPRKSARGKSLLFTFLLLLTLPVFVYSLYQNGNFDIRNRAFEDIEVSSENPCIISFPNVNPYSLEVGTAVRVQLQAKTKTLGIQRISVQKDSGDLLFDQEYAENPKTISETFNLTPTQQDSYKISGLMLDLNGKSYECKISSPYDIQGVKIIANNSKPTFTTTPKDSIPSQAIDTKTTYEYTLVAQDLDQDRINFAYSFTPNVDWLKATVIEDGSNGKLTIKFKGSTEKPASYLANIFIHDGYSKHLSSQSWVISVSPETNDLPIITMLAPLVPMTYKTEESLELKWSSSDQNHISRFELYISSNPTNEDTWIAVDKNISYDQTTYNLDLTKIKDGTYRAILKGIDNQNPPAFGLGVSEEIVIARGNTQTTIGDNVVLPQPQVINMSPSSTDEVKNRKPTIMASLVATENETIDSDSIVVKIDEIDITKDISLNKISDSEYTLIYLPTQDLETGLHKVEIFFQDSSTYTVQKDWTFTIEGDETTKDGYINIFGYEIAQRTIVIVGIGIALVILSIVIPIVVMAVWKDDSKEVRQTNPTLPATLPQDNQIPIEEEIIPNRVEQLTKPVETPQTEVESTQEETFTAPEPIDDLTSISQQLPDQTTEIKKEENTPPTPPEPIL